MFIFIESVKNLKMNFILLVFGNTYDFEIRVEPLKVRKKAYSTIARRAINFRFQLRLVESSAKLIWNEKYTSLQQLTNKSDLIKEMLKKLKISR
jgi:hypothetical protein